MSEHHHTDAAIAAIKRDVGGPEAEPVHRTQMGDVVDVSSISEPHVTIDMLTPLQISALLNGQRRLRRMAGEPEPNEQDTMSLIAGVERIRMLARVLELTLSGHLILDRDAGSELAFRFCRFWVAPADDAAAPEPSGPQLLGADGEPVQRGDAPKLFVPG